MAQDEGGLVDKFDSYQCLFGRGVNVVVNMEEVDFHSNSTSTN